MRWSWILLAAALATPACADTSPKSPSGRTQFSAELDHTVDVALSAIRQREDNQMVDGIRPVEHVMLPGPGGRTALAYARETPDGMTWPLMILIPVPGTGKGPQMAIEAV